MLVVLGTCGAPGTQFWLSAWDVRVGQSPEPVPGRAINLASHSNFLMLSWWAGWFNPFYRFDFEPI